MPMVRLSVGVVGAEKMLRHPPPVLALSGSEKSSRGRLEISCLLRTNGRTVLAEGVVVDAMAGGDITFGKLYLGWMKHRLRGIWSV